MHSLKLITARSFNKRRFKKRLENDIVIFKSYIQEAKEIIKSVNADSKEAYIQSHLISEYSHNIECAQKALKKVNKYKHPKVCVYLYNPKVIYHDEQPWWNDFSE